MLPRPLSAEVPNRRSGRRLVEPGAWVALLALAAVLAGCGRITNPTLHADSRSDTPTAAPRANAAARTTVAGATHLEGDIGPGARWEIDTPAEWNGDLVVYAHGYTDPVAAVTLPAGNFPQIRDALLVRGFAVIASSYSENGYAAKEGAEQTHQLSGVFASKVGQPRRTFLLGQSLGGLIGLQLSEKYPSQYAGTLLVCGVVGGSNLEVEYLGDIRVLFDVVYPGVLPGGLEHPPVITNVNTQVIGPALAAIQADPQGVGVIQALARHPLPGNNGNEVVTSLLNVLAFCMQGGGDLYDRTHQHSFFDNATYTYHSALLPAPLVDHVNATVARYTAAADAERWLSHYGEASGDLRIPLLSLHTTRDPVVPEFHEARLGSAEAGPWLLQRETVRYGHCAFSVDELMTQFEALVAWSTTGQKPAI